MKLVCAFFAVGLPDDARRIVAGRRRSVVTRATQVGTDLHENRKNQETQGNDFT